MDALPALLVKIFTNGVQCTATYTLLRRVVVIAICVISLLVGLGGAAIGSARNLATESSRFEVTLTD